MHKMVILMTALALVYNMLLLIRIIIDNERHIVSRILYRVSNIILMGVALVVILFITCLVVSAF